jgi:hypothetical protein
MQPQEIPADAVRVWRGFRSVTMPLPDFLGRLGSVFIPATVELQIEAGLDAYVPAVPGGLPGKPDTVPDETAILFWDSQPAYAAAFNTLAVRTYTLTHGAVYGPGSGAQFPLPFAGELVVEQPYHLFTASVDWMHSAVQQVLVGRADPISPDDFRSSFASVVSSLQAAGRIRGGIACAGDNYFSFWGAGDGADDAVAELLGASGAGWSHLFAPAPTRLPAGLWDDWPGMTVAAGDSFNMQFARRWETSTEGGGA